MAAVVGFAFLWLSVTPVGKLVFLLVVATIPNAMLCMTTTAGMVQKAAGGRSKSPPLAVKKQQFVGPSLTLPKGREFVLAVFEEVVVGSFPLGKAGMGHYFATAVTMSAGSYLMIREFVTYVTCSRALCYERSCLMIRSWRCGLLESRHPFRAPQCHLLRRKHPPVAYQFHPNMQKHGGGWRFTAKNV